MRYPFFGKTPQISDDVFVAPGARVIGQVVLNPGCSVWYNAVLRGDTNSITIGEGTNIQDNSVLHVDGGEFRLEIGSNVTVGHSCILHGCTVGDNSLIGMGSTVLNGAVIGPNSLVGAGSLVTEGKVFPPRSVIMGRPAKLIREVGPKELAMIAFGARHYQENARGHKASLAEMNQEGYLVQT